MHQLTCTKEFNDIPFAHRQPKHDGHCALVHGHNWGIKVTFGAITLDENKFIIDFGKLQFLKDWIKTNLDHACVINRDDPFIAVAAAYPSYFNLYLVDDCSCEGLARHIFDMFDSLVKEETVGRVFVRNIIVTEDSKNSAAYGF